MYGGTHVCLHHTLLCLQLAFGCVCVLLCRFLPHVYTWLVFKYTPIHTYTHNIDTHTHTYKDTHTHTHTKTHTHTHTHTHLKGLLLANLDVVIKSKHALDSLASVVPPDVGSFPPCSRPIIPFLYNVHQLCVCVVLC